VFMRAKLETPSPSVFSKRAVCAQPFPEQRGHSGLADEAVARGEQRASSATVALAPQWASKQQRGYPSFRELRLALSILFCAMSKRRCPTPAKAPPARALLRSASKC
jgi:hypothetical protein